jgi:apolipoprotein D and lipocalin family protein
MSASPFILRRPILCLLAAGAVAGFAGCASLGIGNSPVRPAQWVDLDAYMGDWFIVAATSGSLPAGSERPIERYLLESDGQIQTTLFAWKGGTQGRLVEIRGLAQVSDPGTNSVWTVSPQGAFFTRQLVILHVASDYHYAVVATPDRRHAWIFSRTRQLSGTDYSSALDVLRSNGIRPGRLIPLSQAR